MNAAVFRSLSSGSAIEAAARRTFSTPQAGVPCQGTVGTSARARLIHFDLAGRYSVKAANAGEMLPRFPAHEHSET